MVFDINEQGEQDADHRQQTHKETCVMMMMDIHVNVMRYKSHTHTCSPMQIVQNMLSYIFAFNHINTRSGTLDEPWIVGCDVCVTWNLAQSGTHLWDASVYSSEQE